MVAVAHQPDCSAIVLELTGRDIPFRAGAVYAVDL